MKLENTKIDFYTNFRSLNFLGNPFLHTEREREREIHDEVSATRMPIDKGEGTRLVREDRASVPRTR